VATLLQLDGARVLGGTEWSAGDGEDEQVHMHTYGHFGPQGNRNVKVIRMKRKTYLRATNEIQLD
jgi:hypothetical protein